MVHLKLFPPLLCTMLVVVSAVAGQKTDPQKPQTWKTYTLKGGEFAVALPADPVLTATNTFNRPKRKNLLGRMLNTTAGHIVYSVEMYENVEPKLRFDEFVAEETTQSRFDVTTEKQLTVDGFAGKEFSSLNQSPPAIVQFFATEQRFYRFAVTGADAKHAGVQRFFSSIRLGAQAAGIEVSEPPKDPLEIDGERIYAGKEVDSKARLLSKPEPQFTEAARRAGTSGTVVLKAVFSATGHVTNIITVKRLPNGLTEQAITAAKRIRFTPAMKDGKPVSLWVQLEYFFNR